MIIASSLFLVAARFSRNLDTGGGAGLAGCGKRIVSDSMVM